MATIHTFTGNEVIATEVPKYLNDNFSALNSVDKDIETQLGAKAPLESPTFTGTPEAPTAPEGTNTTQIATTAYVTSAVKVKSVNGKTGDVVVGDVKNLSISGKTITVTFADDTTKKLTTQDTNTFTGSATSIGGASTTNPAVVTSTYRSGTTWYRVWSDKWVEQGGQVGGDSSTGNNWTTYTVTFSKPFADTNYIITGNGNSGTNTGDFRVTAKTTTTATVIAVSVYPAVQRVAWVARGLGA